MKIDPVNALAKQRVGIRCSGDLRSPTGGRRPPPQTGARRAETSTRAQTMAARPTRNGLRRHPDLPRVWVSNPIEFLSTEEVWAYLLQNPNPWGEAIAPSIRFTPSVGSNSVRPRPSAARPYTPALRAASAPSRLSLRNSSQGGIKRFRTCQCPIKDSLRWQSGQKHFPEF